jgi:predicted metalloprotease
MRWTSKGRSRNLEDRRAQGGRLRRGAPIGLGGILILLLLSFIFKQDFFALLGPGTGVSVDSTAPAPGATFQTTPQEERLVDFVSFVLNDAQQTWARLLPAYGTPYREAKLVLFRDAVQSACGFARSATGPFYCPADQKVYIDLGFYRELRQRFGAAGDFAQAYVLAHEIGHHVQRLLGVESEVSQARRARPDLANELSVRMELQADCFAGVWCYSTAQRDILESGDVEEGLNAAAAIGDERIQRMSAGYVNPDAFTHGSSEQRVEWFRRGLGSGDPGTCDTFSPPRL